MIQLRKTGSASGFVATSVLILSLALIVPGRAPFSEVSRASRLAAGGCSHATGCWNPKPDGFFGASVLPDARVQQDDDVIRVNSNLVVVPVSVTDSSGQPIQGLKATDFHLDEEGRPQKIAQLGDADQVPLELTLLLDVSGSVNARFVFEQEAAARFMKSVMRQGDRAAVYAIDSTSRLIQARAPVEDATRALLTIQSAKSSTAFYDTVVDAARYLSSSTPAQHRRVIIIISDGEDTFSTNYKTAMSALPEVQRANAVVYSINPTGPSLWLNKISLRGQEGMKELAASTGGTAFVPGTLENLETEFRQIASELRAQYLLQYYSDSDAPAGKFLHINVSVPGQPALHTRARLGYYAHQTQNS